MSFRDQRKTYFLAVTLDTDNFAELVTVTPPGGAPREITAKVTQYVNPRTGMEAGDDRDCLRVVVGRDEADAKGGISVPVLGYQLHRASDPAEWNYAWTGQVFFSSTYHWELLFERIKP